MTLFTVSEALWIYLVLAALWLHLLIGTWIGYRRQETFYTHCDKEDECQIACDFIAAFLWPLRFPYDRAHTKTGNLQVRKAGNG
jgi:hypothetical protein